MPDFDIDFCQDRRDEVIRYVQERYGRDQVAQIITFGTLAGARRVARRRPRAADAVRAGRQAVQAGAAESGRPVTLARAIEDEPKLQAERDGDPVVKRAFDIAQEARRSHPPRLDACRRHRDRRPRAVRTGAALSRSEIRHAGDPVQHEMGGAGGPGEIRLPRPQDADGVADRGGAGEAARHRDRSHRHPARRQENLRAAGARRSGRRVPTGKRGHAARAARHAARPFRRHHRAGRALSSRVRWRTSRPIARASTAWSSRTTSTPSSSRS